MEKHGLIHPSYNILQLALLYAMWLAFFLYILRNSWVAEDAYITFRVIENFTAGYGLRWNIIERVQAYTHPLWLLLHLPLHAITHNVFFSSIALSVLCSAAAVLVVMITAHKPVWMTALFLFTPLCLSKAFVHYTSSGLENPLSYLLYAGFIYVLVRKREHRYFWFVCSLMVALAFFNRMDVIWLYAPALSWLMLTSKVHWRQLYAGAIPFVGWLAFSLFYYGFFFANTKYAKLETGMDYGLYLTQGIEYFRHLLVGDSSGAVILLTILLMLLPARFNPIRTHLSLPYVLALGVVLQVIYTVLVGGDYMAGRFWAVPVFATVTLWFVFFPIRWRPDIIFAVACLFVTAHFSSVMLMDMRHGCKECIPLRGRVIDARYVFGFNMLVMKPYNPFLIRSEGHYPFAKEGEKLRKDNKDVKRLFFIGMSAYYAGPGITFIDELGLADPLLARLPASKRQRFYISHFRRDIPVGYGHALETGELDRMQPDLARYYRELRKITADDLWNLSRLKTIFLFNMGYYDEWKDRYIEGMKRVEARSEKRK
ncbi:MAG: hypothetical protein AB7L92_07230 [Alphaproteobacteria bacterium]